MLKESIIGSKPLNYDNLGSTEAVDVSWVDEPPSWKEKTHSASSIIIELHSTDTEV